MKGDRRGDGPPGPKRERGVAGVQAEKVMLARVVQKLNRAREDLPLLYHLKVKKGVEGTTGDSGPISMNGDQGVRGSPGPIEQKGLQDVQGDKGNRGKRGERGVKGEKGIQGDNSNVLSVLADHLPIQLATRYGEKMCFIKYIRG